MPEKKTIERARADKRAGKSPSTQAGEFVRETIEHVRQGKHGVRSPKQAIAIGLSKARRAGVDLPPPAKGTTSAKTRKKARQDLAAGKVRSRPVSSRRSGATAKALKRESNVAVSPEALSRQTRAAVRKRTAADRSRTARKAVATKGRVQLHAAAMKAAQTRARHASI